ncbi:IS256 family transposase [Thermomonas alba]|uniref:IS256 family transposase n=1 Tax=Thermomonas alba TaxID=2888525 RepID=UPI001F03BFAA
MSNDNVVSLHQPARFHDALTALLREQAQQLIQRAVMDEFARFLEVEGSTCPDGRRELVRAGFLPEREILTGLGPVPVKVPKVRDRAGRGRVFRSELVPPYVRKAASVEAVLPWLYLYGISAERMGEALAALLGERAKGLSAATIGRLKATWRDEYAAFRSAPLDRDRWVYLWVDGIHFGIRADNAPLCALVVIGVDERGNKHLLAIEEGYRESTQSWREVLLHLKARGLAVPPELAVGDGAMGFWAALAEVYPATRQQRCWVHKTANVLNRLPKGVQRKAKADLQAIWMAATRAEAHRAFDRFIAVYGAKYPKAAELLRKDREQLLTFYDFPAEHWRHLRTTNPIESTFATVRHRTDRTRGAISRDSIVPLVFKLAKIAETHWRKLNGFAWLAKVITGVRFRDGVEVRDDATAQTHSAAA